MSYSVITVDFFPDTPSSDFFVFSNASQLYWPITQWLLFVSTFYIGRMATAFYSFETHIVFNEHLLPSHSLLVYSFFHFGPVAFLVFPVALLSLLSSRMFTIFLPLLSPWAAVQIMRPREDTHSQQFAHFVRVIVCFPLISQQLLGFLCTLTSYLYKLGFSPHCQLSRIFMSSYMS